jgi:hypothetical protein
MSEQLQLRRGTGSQVASFTGAQGEVVVDTTNNRLVIQDGVTAGGFAAARLSEVITNTRTSVSDAAYAALAADRTIAYVALTVARTVTLPSASAYPTGTRLLVVDESGNCSTANAITVYPNGSDRICGSTSTAINIAYGYVGLESNGANGWTIADQMAPGALATVAQGLNGSSIQFGLLETLVALTGVSTTAAVAIPANCIVIAVGARVVATVTGAPSYSVGISGNASQFGNSLSVSGGSINYGLIGPTAFYVSTPLIITATAGSFTGGAVRLSIHYLFAGAPTS